MKILAKPIEAIVFFPDGADPQPRRFRFEEDGGYKTINIDEIMSIAEQNIAGQPARVYSCRSAISGTACDYELRYLLKDMKWQLYRI